MYTNSGRLHNSKVGLISFMGGGENVKNALTKKNPDADVLKPKLPRGRNRTGPDRPATPADQGSDGIDEILDLYAEPDHPAMPPSQHPDTPPDDGWPPENGIGIAF